MDKFSIEEIRRYLESQDSMGDILYNLSVDKIREANSCKFGGTCINPKGYQQICPLREEIEGIEAYCNCCDECTQNCREEI